MSPGVIILPCRPLSVPLGGFPGELLKKFPEKKLRLQLNNFTQKLIFNVLWFRRRNAYKI